MPVHVETMKLALLLLMMSACPMDFAYLRGHWPEESAKKEKHTKKPLKSTFGSSEPIYMYYQELFQTIKPHYVKRTSGDPWYWLNRYLFLQMH